MKKNFARAYGKLFHPQIWVRELAAKESFVFLLGYGAVHLWRLFHDAFAASFRSQICEKKIVNLESPGACFRGLSVTF